MDHDLLIDMVLVQLDFNIHQMKEISISLLLKMKYSSVVIMKERLKLNQKMIS
jgi:hypothetical protein